MTIRCGFSRASSCVVSTDRKLGSVRRIGPGPAAANAPAAKASGKLVFVVTYATSTPGAKWLLEISAAVCSAVCPASREMNSCP